MIGGAGADSITAGSGTNTVLGDDGEATFAGGVLTSIQSTNSGAGANDVISLQDGTNTVVAGDGQDQVTIGAGTNMVLGDEGSVIVNADGTTTIATINGNVGDTDTIDVGDGFNVAIGGAANDTVTVTGTAVNAQGIVLVTTAHSHSMSKASFFRSPAVTTSMAIPTPYN